MTQKAKVAVIGGGLMGAGIAQIFASQGHSVSVHEPEGETRHTLQGRIAENLKNLGQNPDLSLLVKGYSDLKEAVAGADFVIEAAPERLELKQKIFADLDRMTPQTTILASNTSVIPITRIAEKIENAGRIVGTHFWNPPYLIPLVEVIQAERSQPAAVARMIEFLNSVGKKAVHVKRDVAGFVGNRLQHALWREAIAIVAAGICDAETVDDVVKNSFGMRLAVLGPLENADLVGLDLTLDIHKTILPEIDRSPNPSPLLEDKVKNGELGFKTGKGFKTWTPERMAELRLHMLEHLKNQLPH